MAGLLQRIQRTGPDKLLPPLMKPFVAHPLGAS